MIFFLLDYNKIHKIQKFSALDIVELQSKEMWSVTCVDIIAQVSLTWWSIFAFLDLLIQKLKIIINILPTGHPEIILSATHKTKD